MKENKKNTISFLEKKGLKIVNSSVDDKGYSITFTDNIKEYNIRIEVEKLVFEGETHTFNTNNIATYHRKITYLLKKNNGGEVKKTIKNKDTKKPSQKKQVEVKPTTPYTPGSPKAIKSDSKDKKYIENFISYGQKGLFKEISFLLNKN